MLPSAPVDSAQVVAGAEQVLIQVVLPAGGDKCSGRCTLGPDARWSLPQQKADRPGCPPHSCFPPGQGTQLPPGPGWAGLLGEKDALLEVVIAGGHLLQALEGEAQVEAEPGPHLTQLSPGQRPWEKATDTQGLDPS